MMTVAEDRFDWKVFCPSGDYTCTLPGLTKQQVRKAIDRKCTLCGKHYLDAVEIRVDQGEGAEA